MKQTDSQFFLATSTAATICGMAGPGSGKTATLVARWANFPRPGTHIVTFTNAAADELRRRIDAENLPVPAFIGTLHSLAMRLVKQHWLPEMVLLDQETSDALLRQVLEDIRSKVSAQRLRAALTEGADSQAEKVAVMAYRAKLRTSKCEDFDTLLLTLRDMLADRGPVHIDHLMVDEYQDSGVLDHEIYSMLTCKSRFFVGDPDQSIYGFRGGKLENILELSTTPGVETIFLEENFRSVPQVTEAANRLIRHNRDRVIKTTKSVRQDSGFVSKSEFRNDGEELLEIIHQCRQLKGSTAVLCRYNADRMRISAALKAASVAVVEPERLIRPNDWSLAMAVLAVAANAKNQVMVERLLNLSLGTGAAAVMSRMRGAGGRLAPPDWMASQNLLEVMRSAGLGMETRGTVERAYLAVGGDRSWHAAAAEMAVWCYTATAPPPPPDLSGVQVMTVHGAKGLEFDNVIIPALEAPPWSAGPGAEENRRLLFVAMTRARNKLLMSWAHHRLNQHTHKMEERKVSPFLAEIFAPLSAQ